MNRQKLEIINRLIADLEKEIGDPAWSDDQKRGLRDAQGRVDDVKQSVMRTDVKCGSNGLTHVDPDTDSQNSDNEEDADMSSTLSLTVSLEELEEAKEILGMLKDQETDTEAKKRLVGIGGYPPEKADVIIAAGRTLLSLANGN